MLQSSLGKGNNASQEGTAARCCIFKRLLNFLCRTATLNAKVVGAGRTPRSVLPGVLNINEGLCIKLSDGLFHTFGHGVEPEQFK